MTSLPFPALLAQFAAGRATADDLERALDAAIAQLTPAADLVAAQQISAVVFAVGAWHAGELSLDEARAHVLGAIEAREA